MYIHTYVQRERERVREREKKRKKEREERELRSSLARALVHTAQEKNN